MLCVHCATRPFPQVTAKPLNRDAHSTTEYKLQVCLFTRVHISECASCYPTKAPPAQVAEGEDNIAASWIGCSNNMHLVHDNLVMPCTSCMGPQQDS